MPNAPFQHQERTATEGKVVAGLVSRADRERAVTLLGSNRRRKWIQNLGSVLDPRFQKRIPAELQDAPAIAALLRRSGAGPTCTVMSENSVLDGADLPLAEALQATVGRGVVTLISCIPGVLAYFEDEGAGERYLLERAPKDA
jgi:hypothetical protein